MLRNSLEKEQETSYKTLSDLHKAMQDGKGAKDFAEEKGKDFKRITDELKRVTDRSREMELENEKIKKESSYLMTRTDQDHKQLNVYLKECEDTIQDQR